jgi:alginate O-acetyltransferase complex protein AlgJ
MEEVAGALARLVRQTVDLPAPATPPAWKSVPLPVSRVGDVVDMLKLPEEQKLFVPQAVTAHQVRDDKDAPWQPSEKGDVLLLGDSFTNVFSQEPMGWGEAAGLAPHLAKALGRELDVIARNDAGSYATRKLLSEALGAGEDRLAGKRVVIWEFASRELTAGDWRPVEWPAGAQQQKPTQAPGQPQ